jgi:hypothetical protein
LLITTIGGFIVGLLTSIINKRNNKTKKEDWPKSIFFYMYAQHVN